MRLAFIVFRFLTILCQARSQSEAYTLKSIYFDSSYYVSHGQYNELVPLIDSVEAIIQKLLLLDFKLDQIEQRDLVSGILALAFYSQGKV